MALGKIYHKIYHKNLPRSGVQLSERRASLGNHVDPRTPSLKLLSNITTVCYRGVQAHREIFRNLIKSNRN